MLKKMMLLAISVGALAAFAAPAAQGQELYELSGAEHIPLAVGVGVTATSTNWTRNGGIRGQLGI